jgi:hypothetical protein
MATILQATSEEVTRMNRRSLTRTAGAIGLAFAVAAAACSRDEAGPELQTTTGVQPRLESISARGCLKAGLAENTFVLTTTEAGPQGETATYQLTGPGVPFADHVGQQVEVSGTLRAEQQATSTGVDAVGEPKGTTGTPTVETKTELTLKQMTVSSIMPSGQRCAE